MSHGRMSHPAQSSGLNSLKAQARPCPVMIYVR